MVSECSNNFTGLSVGGGLAALNKDMEKLMECPVCTEIPLPPIYTCQLGHTICSECRRKLKECVLCKSQYTDSRNFSLEAIVLAATFYCENRNRGCAFKDTVEKLKHHHMVCPERRIKCYLSGSNGCHNTLLNMSEYESHLRNVHKQKETVAASNTNVLLGSFSIGIDEVSGSGTMTWVSSLHKYNGKVFTYRIFKRGPIFYIGFYLVGDLDDGSRFAVKTTIQRPNDCHIPKYELSTIVPSIREISEHAEILPDVALHVDLMKKLCQMIQKQEDCGMKTRLRWNIKYEIITLKPST